MIARHKSTGIDRNVTLPDWAFKTMAELAIDRLIDRTEHEVIIITKRRTPDLVLLSHDRWATLLQGAQTQAQAGDLNEKDPQA